MVLRSIRRMISPRKSSRRSVRRNKKEEKTIKRRLRRGSKKKSKRRRKTRRKTRSRRSMKGKMEGRPSSTSRRASVDSLMGDIQQMRRELDVMMSQVPDRRGTTSPRRSTSPRISTSPRRSTSPVVQGKRVSGKSGTPVSSPRVKSPVVQGKRVSGVKSTTRPKAPTRSRPQTAPAAAPPVRPTTPVNRSPGAMKSGRRTSITGDMPEIDAEIRTNYYNSLSAKERKKKGLPASSRFKSTFTEGERKKILEAYNKDWESQDPLKLRTPQQKKYADMRRVVYTGEEGNTPGMKMAIPSRLDQPPGVIQPFRKGSYDTLGTVPPFKLGTLDTESKRLLTKASALAGFPITQSDESVGGGAAKRSVSPHTDDGSEFTIGENVFYYSHTFRDWLTAELIWEGDEFFSLKIIVPGQEDKYIFGSLKDTELKNKIKGKIYIKKGRTYGLHAINAELKK